MGNWKGSNVGKCTLIEEFWLLAHEKIKLTNSGFPTYYVMIGVLYRLVLLLAYSSKCCTLYKLNITGARKNS